MPSIPTYPTIPTKFKHVLLRDAGSDSTSAALDIIDNLQSIKTINSAWLQIGLATAITPAFLKI